MRDLTIHETNVAYFMQSAVEKAEGFGETLLPGRLPDLYAAALDAADKEQALSGEVNDEAMYCKGADWYADNGDFFASAT